MIFNSQPRSHGLPSSAPESERRKRERQREREREREREGDGGGGGGRVRKKVLTGMLRPEVQTLILLYTVFDSKR